MESSHVPHLLPLSTSTFVTTDEPTWIHYYCSKSVVYIRAHCWHCIIHSMDLENYIHHYNITQSSLTALKTSVFPCSYPLPTTDLFTISVVFPFPECYVVGIVQYVAFFTLALSLFFAEVSVQIFCPCFNWVVCFLIVEC